MDPRRQGEIALKLTKYYLYKRGVTFSQNNVREIGNIAKAIGVPLEELKQFFRLIIQEALDEYFAS